MTYRERTKAVCASILLILKNATIVIPVIEGILYTVWDLIKPEKKEKKDEEPKDAEVVREEDLDRNLGYKSCF